MSRPRQTRESRDTAAGEAFRLEVRLQQVHHDMTQGEVADQAGIDRSVLSKFLRDPGKFRVEQLRGVIRTLDISPLTILALLGYEPKIIQNINKEVLK